MRDNLKAEILTKQPTWTFVFNLFLITIGLVCVRHFTNQTMKRAKRKCVQTQHPILKFVLVQQYVFTLLMYDISFNFG